MEKMQNIRIFSTSGNTTALVDVGKNFDYWLQNNKLRQTTGAKIIREKNVEQVGFIAEQNNQVQMVMAADELCGGALIATGFSQMQTDGIASILAYINSRETTIRISRNGIQTTIELPLFQSLPSLLKRTALGTIVFLNGITHVVINTQIPVMKNEALQKAKKVLDSLSNTIKSGVVGVMFISRNNDGTLLLSPVVSVPDVSYLYEQACSTGTAAVALVYNAIDQKKLANYCIRQPSRKDITVTITRNSNKNCRIFISGEVAEITPRNNQYKNMDNQKAKGGLFL